MVSSFEIINNEEPQNQQVFLNRLLNPSIDIASPLGDEQTKITIVEFADYQCPICAQFHRETMESLKENFIDTGKVKFLFKDLIIHDLPDDKASTLAAAASYCAAEQGLYWEYHDELYQKSQGENTGWVTKDNLNLFAKKFGLLDIEKFSDCIDTGKYNQIVNENDSFARNMGLKSVPSFIFYNGTTPVAIQGAQPYEAFEKIITAIS
jgi:protein-disulfide isomerase